MSTNNPMSEAPTGAGAVKDAKRKQPSSSSSSSSSESPTKKSNRKYISNAHKKQRAQQTNLESYFKRKPRDVHAQTDSSTSMETTSLTLNKSSEINVLNTESLASTSLAVDRPTLPKWVADIDNLSPEVLDELLESHFDSIHANEDVVGCSSTTEKEKIEDSTDLEATNGSAASTNQFQQVKTKIQVHKITHEPGNGDTVALGAGLIKDILDFDPETIRQYVSKNNQIQYQVLSTAFTQMSNTKSRLTMTTILTNVFFSILHVCTDQLLPSIYLCSNEIAPSYEGVELGIGPQVLVKLLSSVTDLKTNAVKEKWEATGDWGDLAIGCRKRVSMLVKPGPLTISQVYNTLRRVTTIKGQGTLQQKVSILQKLLLAAQGEEIRYLVRTLVGNLRTGAVRTTVVVALSKALVLYFDDRDYLRSLSAEELKSRFANAQATLRECFAQTPSFDINIPTALSNGVQNLLENCKCRPGVPIRPMLGKITTGIEDVMNRVHGSFICEWKYDGQRAQIHRDSHGTIKIFSRHLEDITDKYPDVIQFMNQAIQTATSSFIIDAEIVAMNSQGEIQPFQTLAGRSRKDVQLGDVMVPVCVLAFDIMFLNGDALVRETYRVRNVRLREAFKIVPNQFDFVKSKECSTREELESMLHEALSSNCEGLMIKVPECRTPPPPVSPIRSTYEPDKRSELWLKLKKDYVDGLSGTFDLVPVGAYFGNGRKVGWWSPFVLACYNPETECFETVCKVMSGFSDEFYKTQRALYSEEHFNLLPSPPSNLTISPSLQPDVYFKPQAVWEIKGADLTLSPVHQAGIGLVSEDKGVSLRFPRFVRVREDKNIEDATTSQEIADAWRRQYRQSELIKSIEVEDVEEVLNDADVS